MTIFVPFCFQAREEAGPQAHSWYQALNNADLVIEYSRPNIYNILTVDEYAEFSKKTIYIAPSLYNSFYFDKQNRSNEILTTFVDTYQPRRRKSLDNLLIAGVNHKNISNCFDSNDLNKLCCNTKILINIHQTDHDHTFEELRVLPALLCGVLVISEESPLSHLIPYKDYIIWSSYDQIIEKTIEVSNNYEYYHDKIFGGSNNLLKDLHFSNLETLRNKIFELSNIID